MNGTIVGAMIGAAVLVAINAALFSYYYGRVTEKVDSHEVRLTAVENDLADHANRLQTIEAHHRARGISL